MKILDEHVLYQQGSFKKVRRWIEGWHPHLGLLTWGITGKETIVEETVIKPQIEYHIENTPQNPHNQNTEFLLISIKSYEFVH